MPACGIGSRNAAGETFKCILDRYHQGRHSETPRRLLCPAMWVVETPSGPVGSKDRKCARTATMEVDTGGGSMCLYCPAHGADRAEMVRRDKARRKAAQELHDRRWHFADEFTAGLPSAPGTSKGTGKRPPPSGCTIVHAIKCGCGEVFARERFPDHYANCEKV